MKTPYLTLNALLLLTPLLSLRALEPLPTFTPGTRILFHCDKLIRPARAGNPKLKLVLGAPFVKPTGKVKEGIQKRQAIVARLAQKQGAALVRFQPIFDAAAKRAPADYWIWDQVHPTYSGHQLMAEEWERVVRDSWK